MHICFQELINQYAEKVWRDKKRGFLLFPKHRIQLNLLGKPTGLNMVRIRDRLNYINQGFPISKLHKSR